jgi:hypothetical protein
MRLDKDLAEKLPLELALDEALQRPGDFFPSRIAFAAAKRSPSIFRSIRTNLVRDWKQATAESVQVPKWGGGTRPAIDIALRDRLVLDGLIRHLKSEVVPGLVNWSPRGEERRRAEGNLVQGPVEYVLMTDVAAFYEYVDHDLLTDEMLDLTADEPAVMALAELLASLANKPRGLPQGPVSVGDLADIYLSMVDRRLVRDGYRLVRFTDDYRIAAESWLEAQRAQVRLETYLRDVGLVINAGKTRSPRSELYVSWETANRPEWAQEVADAVTAASPDTGESDEDGWIDVTEYSEIGFLPDGLDRESLLPQVEHDLAMVMGKPDFWGTSSNQGASRRLKLALPVLGKLGSLAPLEYLPKLIRSFPHLAMEVSLYLRDVVDGESSSEVLEALADTLESEGFLFDWQLGWFLHALVPATETLPTFLMDLATAQLYRSDAPWFVRGRAAAVMATEQKLPLGKELAQWLEEAPAATKPDFIAAASRQPDVAHIAGHLQEPGLREVPEAIKKLGVAWL